MFLYHVTTQKKARRYAESGKIKSPVRGFTTMAAAMGWAIKTGRTVILLVYAYNPHKLPDHRNKFGQAWWNDGDIYEWSCEFSADKDA